MRVPIIPLDPDIVASVESLPKWLYSSKEKAIGAIDIVIETYG